MNLAKSFVVVCMLERERKREKNIPDEGRFKTHKNTSESCIEIQQQQQQQRKVKTLKCGNIKRNNLPQ